MNIVCPKSIARRLVMFQYYIEQNCLDTQYGPTQNQIMNLNIERYTYEEGLHVSYDIFVIRKYACVRIWNSGNIFPVSNILFIKLTCSRGEITAGWAPQNGI